MFDHLSEPEPAGARCVCGHLSADHSSGVFYRRCECSGCDCPDYEPAEDD